MSFLLYMFSFFLFLFSSFHAPSRSILAVFVLLFQAKEHLNGKEMISTHLVVKDAIILGHDPL